MALELFEKPLIKEGASELKEFKDEEIKEIVQKITNDYLEKLSPLVLAKINNQNLNLILNLVEEEISKERKELNKKRYKDLEIGVEEIQISAASHMLLCTINSSEDFKAFRDVFEKFVKEKNLAPDNEEITYLRKTLNRYIEIEETLKDLFKIDIKRRIGELKNNETFWEKGFSETKDLIPRIEKILNYFRQKEVWSESNDLKDLLEKIEEDIKLIKEQKIESIKDKFYNFCWNLSLLGNIDFEKLNTEKIKRVVKNLNEFTSKP